MTRSRASGIVSDRALALAARAFVEADCEVDTPQAAVTVSKILDWYGADFGADQVAVLGRLQGFLPEESTLHAELGEVLRRPPGELTVDYRAYDWGTNDAAGAAD